MPAEPIFRAGMVVTQSSADTYTDETLQTGLSAVGKQAWAISGIEFELDPNSMVGWAVDPAANIEFEVQISTKTHTSIQDYEEESLICKRGLSVSQNGASAHYQVQRFNEIWVPPEPILVVSSKLVFGVSSAATTKANVAGCRIYYRTVKVSVEDFLRVLNDQQ